MSLTGTLSRGRLLAGAGALAAALPLNISAARSAELVQLRVMCVQTDGIKSLLYARQAGLFAKQGMAIDVIAMASGGAILPALLGGASEISAQNMLPLYMAYSRGIQVRMIAPASLYLSSHADSLMLVRKDSPLRGPRDLNNKTIGVDSLNDLYTVATKAWVDNAGGDSTTLRLLELRPAEQLAGLDAGRVDASVFKTPFLTVALETGRFRVLGKPLDAIGPRFLASCWIATADYIAKHSELVASYAKVMAEAARYTNAHQDETVPLISAFTGQDPALTRRSIRSTTAETVTLEDLQRTLNIAVRYGLIPQRFDVSALLAPSFQLAKGS